MERRIDAVRRSGHCLGFGPSANHGYTSDRPAERALPSHDGMTITLAGRPLLLLDTPGHARHHHCLWDARSRGWFTGDTFGLSYREFDTASGPWIMPTSTPVQFDPPALRASVLRLLSYQPQTLYLTHFGPVGTPDLLATRLLEMVDAMVGMSLALPAGPERHAQLKQGLQAQYLQRLQAHGCVLSEARQLELLAMDIELNAQGLGIWLDKQAKA